MAAPASGPTSLALAQLREMSLTVADRVVTKYNPVEAQELEGDKRTADSGNEATR
jgi:hypothetical protein